MLHDIQTEQKHLENLCLKKKQETILARITQHVREKHRHSWRQHRQCMDFLIHLQLTKEKQLGKIVTRLKPESLEGMML